MKFNENQITNWSRISFEFDHWNDIQLGWKVLLKERSMKITG